MIKNLSFESFIKRDFHSYPEDLRTILESDRNQLNLTKFHNHFKLNGMSEEKFYLSTHEEIKQWLSQLQDRNFESKQTIFDEGTLNAVFGDYLIAKTNIRNNLDDLDENISNKEIKQRIEQEIGKNPLMKSIGF